MKELFSQNLMQRVEREEELRATEYEMRESICEQEKRPILGEEDDDNGMTMCSDKCKRRMLEASSETKRSHGFNFNYLCAYVQINAKEGC